MKAAVLTGAGEIAMAADWPEPEPRQDEVVVALTGVGLCGSDLAVWSGGRPVDFPWIVGHEGTGTIVAVGAGVSSERIGDRVVIEPNYPCGACDGCRRGRTAMSEPQMPTPLSSTTTSPRPGSGSGQSAAMAIPPTRVRTAAFIFPPSRRPVWSWHADHGHADSWAAMRTSVFPAP